MSLTLLKKMYDEAMTMYSKSNSDYDKGICEGLKRIIEIMESENPQIWFNKLLIKISL